MADQLVRYEIYAHGIKRLLLFAGLWPGPVSSKLYQYVAIIHVITCIASFLVVINFIISCITNLGLVIKGLAVATSFIVSIVKITVLSIYRPYLLELHTILETSFRKDLASPELQYILLSPLEYFYRPALWLSSSMWAILGISFITPIISVSMQKAHGISPVRYRLPLPSKYPWTVTENRVLYSVQYFIETWACFTGGAITTSTDVLFGFYIFQMASQLRTLSYRMSNLKVTDNYIAIMKECALRYRTLIHCRDNLELIYGPIIVVTLTTSAMIICAYIFQASQISLGRAPVIIMYILMKLMQAFLYGWCGLFLTTESEAFRESIYSSGWPGTIERSFLSNIRIMLMYKPLVLTACHVFVISLDMFVGIMDTALSYFFLLRTLDEGK